MRKWAFRAVVAFFLAVAIFLLVWGLAGLAASTDGRECAKAKTVLICNDYTCQQVQKCVEWAKGDTMETIKTTTGIVTLMVHEYVAAYITIMPEGEQPQRLSFGWHEIDRAKNVFNGFRLVASGRAVVSQAELHRAS